MLIHPHFDSSKIHLGYCSDMNLYQNKYKQFSDILMTHQTDRFRKICTQNHLLGHILVNGDMFYE